ncbi:hypothetical protein AGMMS49579_24140 [Spirochaetia bacterium]|nr:hypothetical protein AGMMS49579_24140 [Spirochaetia bacterium]
METQNINSENSNTVDSGIVFDTASGISESEQREIFAGIENITAQNRISLSEEQKNSLVQGSIQAKRGGGGFPLIVNIVALLLLVGAVFLLYFFHNKDEVQIREGRAGYNSAERALIQEIRRETARELEKKESEIALIAAKLSGVDTELQELYSNNQELSAEQRTVEMNLQRLQEEYRSSLGSLQNERSQILEASRAREASLRAQLEERTSELAAVSEQSRAARSELDRLTSDTERAAAIEAQLSAHYAAAAVQIFSNNLDAAKTSLEKMREFLNTPSFQSIRIFQDRKALYLTSINALKEMIDKAEETEDALAAGNAEYEDRIELLQNQKNEYEKRTGDLERDLKASETRITTLQNQVSGQQRTLNERDAAAVELRALNANLTRTVTARESTITELRAQNAEQAASIESLNSQLANIRQTLQSLSQ